MKSNKIILTLIFIFSLFIYSSCSKPENNNKAKIVVKESDIVKEKLKVEGMTCVGCEVTLEKNISKIKGVVHVRASASKDEAIIEFDSTKTDLHTIAKTIQKSGYVTSNK